MSTSVASASASNSSRDGQYVTTQQTGKGLKTQQILAVLLLIVSIVAMIATGQNGTPAPIWGLTAFAAVAWYIGVRIATWWRHG